MGCIMWRLWELSGQLILILEVLQLTLSDGCRLLSVRVGASVTGANVISRYRSLTDWNLFVSLAVAVPGNQRIGIYGEGGLLNGLNEGMRVRSREYSGHCL